MTYAFDEQLVVGATGEQRLDTAFGQWYDIAPATQAEQRQGIDRIYLRRKDGARFRVEYKTDHTAARTGNAFVETISVDTTNKPGWAYTSQADVLLYYIPGDELVYVWRLSKLRRHLERWQTTYATRRIPNKGYATHGILVPLSEFERHAEQVISL